MIILKFNSYTATHLLPNTAKIILQSKLSILSGRQHQSEQKRHKGG